MVSGRTTYPKKTIDGEEYWSPLSHFTRNQEKLLNLWRIHYHRLGIRTRTVRGELWVNIKDDLSSWSRELPFNPVTYETQARVYEPKST